MKPEIMQRVADTVRRTLRFLRGWIAAPSATKPASEMGRATDANAPVWRDRDSSMP
jgi:hypothetical protein